MSLLGVPPRLEAAESPRRGDGLVQTSVETQEVTTDVNLHHLDGTCCYCNSFSHSNMLENFRRFSYILLRKEICDAKDNAQV